jgi:periodic tryptophan protein 1
MGEKANIMAVGTFLPEIEIWNLDSESCDPVAVLGDVVTSEAAKQGQSAVSKKYKKQQPSLVFHEDTHTDSVLSLSVNPF